MRLMTRTVNCACKQCQRTVKDIEFIRQEIKGLGKITKVEGRSIRRIDNQYERFKSIRMTLDKLYYAHQTGEKNE